MGKDKDKHEAHEQPEARERRLRKRFAKKWNLPCKEFKIKVGRFIIDRTIPKIYLD